MAALAKPELAKRIVECLEGSRAQILEARFHYPTAPLLPWLCRAKLADLGERRFAMYFWTIGHGGRTRSPGEYRIQTKLEGGPRQLAFDQGTTLLLGYYRSDLDASGRAAGNDTPRDMEVFVAWDPLHHLRLGSSSSCQVPLRTLMQAREAGLGEGMRTLPSSASELVIAVSARNLDLYLEHASLGHGNVDLESLGRAVGMRRVAG